MPKGVKEEEDHIGFDPRSASYPGISETTLSYS